MSRRNAQARRGIAAQAGSFMIEFALVFLFFLTFIFCILELARAMYLWNTLQEVTRRAAHAAASADFHDQDAMNLVRQSAIFRTTAGKLIVGDPVTDEFIRIDYLALVRNGDGSLTMTPIPPAAMPSCPARNRYKCLVNSNDASCIRFVRVRVCQPGDPSTCDPASYVPMLPLTSATGLTLPKATTIVKAETLGYKVGSQVCP